MRGKKVAVDASIWMYRLAKAMPGKEVFHVVIKRLCRFKFYEMTPIFIFDGNALPPLKKETLSERRNKETAADAKMSLLSRRLLLEKVATNKFHATLRPQQIEETQKDRESEETQKDWKSEETQKDRESEEMQPDEWLQLETASSSQEWTTSSQIEAIKERSLKRKAQRLMSKRLASDYHTEYELIGDADLLFEVEVTTESKVQLSIKEAESEESARTMKMKEEQSETALKSFASQSDAKECFSLPAVIMEESLSSNRAMLADATQSLKAQESLKLEDTAAEMQSIFAQPVISFTKQPVVAVKQNAIEKEEQPNKQEMPVEVKSVSAQCKDLTLEWPQKEKQIISLSKQAAKPDSDFVSLLKEALALFSIRWMHAPGEAEIMCAAMQAAGQVDAVVSDDVDCFLFGATCVIRNFYEKAPAFYNTGKCCFDREALIAFAFYLPSDYSAGVKGIGPVKARDLISKHAGNVAELISQNAQQFQPIFTYYKTAASSLQLPASFVEEIQGACIRPNIPAALKALREHCRWEESKAERFLAFYLGSNK